MKKLSQLKHTKTYAIFIIRIYSIHLLCNNHPFPNNSFPSVLPSGVCIILYLSSPLTGANINASTHA